MKNNRKNYHAGRIVSLLLVLCMVLSIVPITAFAGVTDVTGGSTSNVYKHTYHTKVKMNANVTVQDSEGNTVNTYPVSEESDFLVGNVSDDGKTLVVAGYPSVIATNGTTQDDYVIDNVVINGAPASCTVGEAPKAMATKGDNEPYTFYEYWEEWAETEEGLEPVKFWYSDADRMSRVSADKRITAFEEGKTYSYSIIAEANENYTFVSKNTLSVMLNGEDFIAKSEVILDGKSLMIGLGSFMQPVKPATQKEIELIEINNATVSFKVGDKPIFTGTVPDGALYAIDYEGWFGEDDEFISSSDYWNSAYVERDWCDGLISSFKANTEYTYQLYLKLTDEAAAQGYVFGSNTKLKVNEKTVTGIIPPPPLYRCLISSVLLLRLR